MRHICTQGDQIKRKIFISRCQFVKCNEFKPIHIIALRAGTSSSLHTIILRNKTLTKQLDVLISIKYIFPSIRIRYFIPITINTHIDCSNNSKCSVRDILLAINQGAFFVHFLLPCFRWIQDARRRRL